MPTFSRTYTQTFVDNILPATLLAAKEIEGNPHIQGELATLGATTEEDDFGNLVYQMDSIPPKDQLGLLFDWWLWRNYKVKSAQIASETAIEASNVATEDEFEGGGAA